MMKQCVLLLLVCVYVCVHGAPVDTMEAGTCDDRATVGLAALALTKINEDRTDGFVLRLEALSNAHQMKHGETGMVYYLTLDVAETKCHVLSKQAWKDCEPRGMESSPVTGQCKAVIYINKVKRIDRLYKYICNLRPVSVSQIVTECPDCPTMVSQDNSEVEKTLKLTMEKFNKEGGQDKYFVPLNITKVYSQGGIIDMYAVEYIIQETVCSRSTDITEAPKCDKMTCEFAHKGHCEGSYTRTHTGEEFVEVTCKIFEPEAAEEEKKRHLLGGELDHSHSSKAEVLDGHDHTHDHTRPHTDDHTHDHSHGDDHDHSKDKGHHHTHEHKEGHGHAHVHEHSHDHAHDHDHVHAHHSKAHDHSQDQGEGHHHQYAHDHDATHEHDHELALDHQHQHRHLHQHEHHHHHHDHPHHPHDHPHARRPEGSVHLLPALDGPATLPFFPDQPADADPGQASTLPFFPDSEAPGEREPTILPFPRALSPQCPSTPRPLDKPGA